MHNTKDPTFIRAVHEAGHGVICHYLGVIPQQLTIREENDNGFGQCKNPIKSFSFENDTLSLDKKTKSLAMVYVAGYQAVKKIEPNAIVQDFDLDYKQAMACLSSSSKNVEENKSLLKDLEMEVREIFSQEDRWHGVEKLSEELLAKKNLQWKEAKAVLQQLMLRPRFRIS